MSLQVDRLELEFNAVHSKIHAQTLQMEKSATAVEEAARRKFGAVLRGLREERDSMSREELARRASYSPSRIAHVEGGTQSPTERLAERCDRALNAHGSVLQAYRVYCGAAVDSLPVVRSGTGPAKAIGSVLGSSLIVIEEIATLVYQAEGFEIRIVRHLFNNSPHTHTRWPVRIAVEASERWSPLGGCDQQPGLEGVVPEGWCRFRDETGKHVERMTPALRKDNPTEREFWLEFRDASYWYPLWPGREATIEYSYRVSHDCWGGWFQRAIRMPTGRLVLRLDFPDSQRMGVYGLVESTEGSTHFERPIDCEVRHGRQLHHWSTPFPPIQARYRLAWRP